MFFLAFGSRQPCFFPLTMLSCGLFLFGMRTSVCPSGGQFSGSPVESSLWKGAISKPPYFWGTDCIFWPKWPIIQFLRFLTINPVSAIPFIRKSVPSLESLISQGSTGVVRKLESWSPKPNDTDYSNGAYSLLDGIKSNQWGNTEYLLLTRSSVTS